MIKLLNAAGEKVKDKDKENETLADFTSKLLKSLPLSKAGSGD